jgi:hypothetical protein
VYLVCFLAGATVMVCQFFMGLLGLGGHHDIGDSHDLDSHDAHVGPDHDVHDTHHETHTAHHDTMASWFVSMLTVRTLVAAITFFGLVGLAAGKQWGEDNPTTHVVAVASGAAAMFMVAWLMRSMSRLRAEGTVRMDRAVGQSGTVYLPIPGQRAGLGKILLNLQNRTVECQAMTAKQDLPTGAKVTVVAVVSPDTVEVAPSMETGSTSHA